MSGSNGFLTTHVLDTARGVPAVSMRIDLFKSDGASMKMIASTTTNEDGRTDAPILPAEKFTVGRYELVFHVGDYLRRTHSNLDEPLFLDEVPIRFGINDSTSHYHVPLLISPFGYSTYRGS